MSIDRRKSYKVLERFWTVSGKMHVSLNAFDDIIAIGSRLTDSANRSWSINGREKTIGRVSDEVLQREIRELGAVLFHIDPIGHNALPAIGDELSLMAEGD